MARQAIAVVGCGAIAEAFHLPAIVRHDWTRERLVLVDPNAARRHALAERFGVSRQAADLREVLPEVRMAFVLTPHPLHASVTLACVEEGASVLTEKPIAESAAEAAAIAAAAEKAGVIVAVNNTRRFFPSFRKVADLLAAGELGSIHRLDLVLGEKYDWPAASGSYFGTAAGGKGVLLDTGAHVVDLACWWGGGRPTLVDYQDDSMGGTEAVADIKLRRGDCEIAIRLSWLSRLSNRYRIEGEKGLLQGEMYDYRHTTLVRDGQAQVVNASAPSRNEISSAVIDNFFDAVDGRVAPAVTVRDVLPSIEVIEECYANRRRLDMPWFDAWKRVLAND